MKQQTTIIEEIVDTKDCITTSKCSSPGATSKSHSGFSDYTSSCSALSTYHSTVKFEDNKPQNQITKNILEINKQRMKLPSSKYRGAVPQANGRWGAQLYNGHRRIWLGTFDCQDQAARAHDLAALRFRGAHAAVNFPGRHYSRRPHLEFLAAHSMAEVVAMLRCHTYDDELARFMRSRLAAANNRTKKPPSPSHDPGVTRRRLFQKVLTASDVGNGTLHRLVIPRCHAERDLPALSGGGSSEKKGMTLTFEEIGGGERMWRFKFCYWKGSKNYVLTKGWSHFVRVKDLKPGDVVTFYTSSVNDVGDENHQKQRLYIESSSNSGSNMSSASPNCLFRSETTAAKFSASSTVSSNISSDDQHSDYEEDNSRLRILRLFGFDIDLH